MELTDEEQAMLDGAQGPAVQEAIAYLIKVGEFWGARRLVPVTNVHMMGDIEVMGDGGLKWLECTAARKARCAVNVSTNARCFDFALVDKLRQDAGEAVKERKLIGLLQQMDVTTTDTCINYQTLYQPHLGEHVAWGDTGTVIYANSVFGARSNFESGPAAFAAGLTGRVPEYGFHLDEHRRGTFVVELDADLDDLADWGAVSKLVGEANQSYYAVPVFTGLRRTPTSDELKHLGAALASYGSMGMFHMVGVTPEAPTVEAALGGNTPHRRMKITDAGHRRGLPALRPEGRPLRPGRVLRPAAVALGDEEPRRALRGPEGASGHPGIRHQQQRRDLRCAKARLHRKARERRGDDDRGRVLLHPAEPVADAEAQRLDQHGLQLGQDRQHHRRAPLQHHPAADTGLRGHRLHREHQMSDVLETIQVERAFGPVVEGEAVVSDEGFSPRYDLDRWTGLITKPGHKLEGTRSATRSASSRPPRAASPPAGPSTTSSTRASRRGP